jgi:hypothetical protein
MTTFVTLVAILCLFIGLAAGWYLRRVNTWCPECGETLACTACGGRPALYPENHTRRTAR